MHTDPSSLYAYGCFKTENVVIEVRLVLLNWGISGQSPGGCRTRRPVISTGMPDFLASDVGQVASQARVILRFPSKQSAGLAKRCHWCSGIAAIASSIIHTTE
jgi:hypothetical protein